MGQRGAGNLADFKKELATLGWQEGANYVLEEVYAAGQPNRLPALAEELAAKRPALIVTTPASATTAAAKAAPKIPIVLRSYSRGTVSDEFVLNGHPMVRVFASEYS